MSIELVSSSDSPGEWNPVSDRKKSWVFRCSICSGIAYYVNTAKNGKKYCLYRYCPNCGHEMDPFAD